MSEKWVKFIVIAGGGFAMFWLFRHLKGDNIIAEPKAGFAGSNIDMTPPTEKQLLDAEIVTDAYIAALEAGEPAEKLTELNGELIKEFGMRCYLKDAHLVVCDVMGKQIMVK